MKDGSGAQVVRSYYELVDGNEVQRLVALYAEDAVYERPGYPAMQGRQALESFYSGTRVIASGHHTLLDLVENDSHVAVSGHFDGVLRDGSRASIDYADFFEISRDGHILRRKTFFYEPAV